MTSFDLFIMGRCDIIWRMNVKEMARNGLTAAAVIGASAGVYYASHELRGTDNSTVGVHADLSGQQEKPRFTDFTMGGIKVELTTIEEIAQPNHTGMKTISVHGKTSEDLTSVDLNGWTFGIIAGNKSYDVTIIAIPSTPTDSSQPGFNKDYPFDIRLNALVPDSLSGYSLDVVNSALASDNNSGEVGDSSKNIPLSPLDVTPVPAQEQPNKA